MLKTESNAYLLQDAMKFQVKSLFISSNSSAKVMKSYEKFSNLRNGIWFRGEEG